MSAAGADAGDSMSESEVMRRKRLRDEQARNGLREACDATQRVVSEAIEQLPAMMKHPVLARELGLILGRQMAFAGMLAVGAAPYDRSVIGLAMVGMHDIFADIAGAGMGAEGTSFAWVSPAMRRCAGFFLTALLENGFDHLLIGRGE